MNFQKFVHRSTKGLFLFIAIMMIVPLVLWGYMGRGPGDKEGQEDAGIIFRSIHVSKATFNQHKRRAMAGYYYGLFRKQPWLAAYAIQGRRLPEPKSDDLVKLAWRNIVLLEDAKQRGIPAATKSESQHKSEQIFMTLFQFRIPHTAETVPGVAQQVFHVTVADYDDWVDDLVVVDKLLDTMAAAEFAGYDKIYDRVMNDQQSVKVTFAGFDPKDYIKELKPPRTEEIAKYYQDNKTKFRAPEKVVISYLIADYETLKKGAPEPSEDEVKKYYDDHLSEFQKPAEHKHGPGEEHKEDEKPTPPETKPLQDVRGEIPDKIKQRWAEEKAAAIMKDANTELGQAFVNNGNKYPENVLDELKEKFDREKNVKFLYDVTTPFDRRHVEEVEKLVGTGGGLEGWAFDAKRAEGEISNILTTSKGKAFFKLLKKIPANDNPGVTAQNRDAIVKELQKEQLRKRAQQQASAIVEEIKSHGIAEARLKFPADWRSSRYFKTQFNRMDPGADDPGVEDRALGSALRAHVSQTKPKAGEATVLQGSNVGGEKRDWAFVVYVDDVLSTPPADFDGKFREVRREMDNDERERYKKQYGDNVVLLAEVQDLINKSSPGAPSSTPAIPSFPDEDN